MDTTKVGEKVKTGVVFEKGEPKPKWFLWKNKRINAEEITYTWRTAEGNAVIVHFSVAAGGACYELNFNQKSMEWILENVAC